MAELVQFREASEKFRREGVALAGLSVDRPDGSRKLHQDKGLGFPLLSDPELEWLGPAGLRHPKGHGGRDIAHPAGILADRSGRVVWTHQGHNVQDRAAPDRVLAAIDEGLDETGGAGRA